MAHCLQCQRNDQIPAPGSKFCEECRRDLIRSGMVDLVLPGEVVDGRFEPEGWIARHKRAQQKGEEAVTEERKQYSIGAVGFWKDGQRYEVMGNERVNLLRLAYYRMALPDGIELRSDWYNGSLPLTWEDVRWDTSGIPQERV